MSAALPHALVTGASGFIGGHLCQALHLHGWQVSEARRVQGETRIQDDQLAGVDVVFHLAGMAHAGVAGARPGDLCNVNATATATLYQQAMRCGVNKFVWVSSIKVLGEAGAQALSETSPPAPADAYAASKAAGERLLLQHYASDPAHARRLVIVRPPLVYGVGVKANFRSMLGWALSGWPLPLAAATQPRAWVGVENLVSLLMHSATATDHDRVILHVRDTEQISVAQMLTQIASLGGQQARLWYVAPWLLHGLARIVGRQGISQRLLSPLPVDMALTQQALHWQPPHSQAELLAKVVAWQQA